MDTSDIIKQRRGKTIFNNLIENFNQKSPSGECAKLKTACCEKNGCIRNFVSFDVKQSFELGQRTLSGCQ